MCNVKPETDLSKPKFYEATTSGSSTRGLMVYTGLAIVFYKIKPPGLNIEQMSKFIETDFVRFLYSDGSEASSEKR